MSLGDNIFNAPAETGGPLWANEVDYSAYDTSAAYPTSVMDSGGGLSASWEKLFQGSLSKGLDYFVQKDAFQTRQDALPKSYASQYIRGADGRLYQSNGLPVTGYQSNQQSSNPLFLLAVAAGIFLLARA